MKKLLRRKNALFVIWFGKKLVILSFMMLMGIQPIFAQQNSILKKKVSVHFTDTPLKKVLDNIQKKTGIIFLYSSEKLNVDQKTTIHLDDIALGKVLSQLLAGTGLVFDVDDYYIVIKPTQEYQSTDPNELFVFGNVVDDQGEPLVGATVMVKETQAGVITDGNGYYNIQTTKKDTVILVYSFIGMQNKEVIFSGLNPMNIQMDTDITMLFDIVVTGYQNLEEQRVAGAVSSVKGEELQFATMNSIEQALQGAMPGISIVNVSGEVGVRQKTRVRGTSTFSGNQEPIWVVDGIIQEDPLPFKAQDLASLGQIDADNFDYIRNYVGNAISWLNPNDIEDITVLKDASATAIYGVRAANGVFVIRTKQGEEGPLSVSYSTNLNIGEKITYDKLELMNSRERVGVSREIFDRGLTALWTNNNIGYAGALQQYLDKQISYEDFNRQVADMESVNTDWFDLLFRNPFSQSHSVSVSGGTEKVRVYSSLGYNKREGTAIGNDQSGYTGSLGLSTNFNEKLSVNLRLAGAYSETTGFYQEDPYKYATSINRSIPAYQEDGELLFYQKENGYLYNFINERNESGNENKNLSLNSNLNINYDITHELKLNVLGGLNISSIHGSTYATERTNYIAAERRYDYGTANATNDSYKSSPLPIGGVYNEESNNLKSWNFRTSFSYDKMFHEKHAFTSMIGFEMASSKYDGHSSTAYGYLRDRGRSFAKVPLTTSYNGFSSPNDLYDKFVNHIVDNKTNNVGYYLTINYAYDNRYVLNFSVRGDASNRFGQYTNEQFNPVWAGGLRWNVMNEAWMQSVNWITNLSLRGTYGYQRNMATGYSPNLVVQVPTDFAAQIYDVNTGDYLLNISNLPYADLRWEQTTSYNVGADFGLFNNRVSVSADYYMKKGKDMISELAVPVEYGVDVMPVNGGSMTNKGYELSVGLVPVRTKNFTWSLNLNTSKNDNNVDLIGAQNPTWQTAASGGLFKAGYATSSFWAFKFKGIDPENGNPIFDLSYDENTNPDDDPTTYMKYAGKADPDFIGGLGTSFRYKQFSLSANFYLQLGGKRFLAPAYPSSVLPSEYENLSSELNGRWTPDNVTAKLPGLPGPNIATTDVVVLPGTLKNTATLYEMYNYSTDRVVSASTLRCSGINLSYSFNTDVCEKLKCKGISMGLSAANVFSIVSKDFHGRDAEVATGNQPRTRSYSFSLNVNF